jgi:hypothetical protein
MNASEENKLLYKEIDRLRADLKESEAINKRLFQWNKTSERLPADATDLTGVFQINVVMWSDGWGSWLKGVFTSCGKGRYEWADYDQKKDRLYTLDSPPEYWMAIDTPKEVAIKNLRRAAKGHVS